MKNLVYQSKFQKIYFSEQDKIFEVFWENTQELSDIVYREELEFQIEKYQNHKGKGTLLNTSSFEFVISISTQEWTGKHIFLQARDAGIQYVAVLVSQEFYAQLSIELNMDEDTKELFTTKYFTDIEDARKWLKANV